MIVVSEAWGVLSKIVFGVPGNDFIYPEESINKKVRVVVSIESESIYE